MCEYVTLNRPPRKIETLELDGPRRVNRGEAVVHRLQRAILITGDLLVGDDDKVDITVLIEVAARQGAIQIHPDKVAPQDCLHALQQLLEQRVHVRIRCRTLTGIHRFSSYW